ncbi:fe(2+) transport protein 1-like [Forsythia ovata]|uniref:Fe(2+) transport protein 1-like n=1 Tax=Forsythia ovata TaxID=205694 RepID=A0ABD1QGL4_9LAMI
MSGKTCINPVPRIIPEAKDLTMIKRLRSGLRAGIEHVTRGKHTSIMLMKRMEEMAMIFRCSALALLLQLLFDSASHTSSTDTTCVENMEIRKKTKEMSFKNLETIYSLFFLKSVFKL